MIKFRGRGLMWAVAIIVLAAQTLVAAPAGKRAQPLGERNYWVRVGVARKVKTLALKVDGTYSVGNPNGVQLGALAPGGIYFVEIRQGKPGDKAYRLVLDHLSSHQSEQAIAASKEAASAYKLPTRIIRVAGGEGGDEKLLITAGEFSTQVEARKFAGTLPEDAFQYIYEDKAISRSGRVLIRDEQGKTIASDLSLLRLSPGDQTKDAIHLHPVINPATCKLEDIDKGKHYRGIIDLAIDEEGKLTGVNTVWLEHYLYGVVAAEMGDFGSLEALKAQAVLARSQAMGRIENGFVAKTALYDFDDTHMIQSYKGKGLENPRIRQAVDGTRGEVLVHNGKPIEAPYSQNCGGVIPAAHEIWDVQPSNYFVRKADRPVGKALPNLADPAVAAKWITSNLDCFCNPAQGQFPQYMKDSFHWSKTFSADQLTKIFDKSAKTGKVKDVIVEKRTASGRVRGIRVVGLKKSVRYERELSIREAFDNLRSTFFVLEPKYDSSKNLVSLTIRGAGYGHGVGLCQMGAIVMADKGYGYRQILGQYYSNVKIRRLY